MDILTIGGASPIDLLDRSRYLGFTVADDSIHRTVDIASTGCTANAGRSAILRRARTLGYTRRYTLFATGMDEDDAIFNISAVENEILAAEKFNQRITDDSDGIVPHEVWIVRRIRHQTRPTVWTVLYGSVTEAMSVLMSVDSPIEFVSAVELFLMKGARNLDANGFPIPAV
jgi:hypothetical protein